MEQNGWMEAPVIRSTRKSLSEKITLCQEENYEKAPTKQRSRGKQRWREEKLKGLWHNMHSQFHWCGWGLVRGRQGRQVWNHVTLWVFFWVQQEFAGEIYGSNITWVAFLKHVGYERKGGRIERQNEKQECQLGDHFIVQSKGADGLN